MFSKHIPFFTVFYEYSPSLLIYYKEASGQKLEKKITKSLCSLVKVLGKWLQRRSPIPWMSWELLILRSNMSLPTVIGMAREKAFEDIKTQAYVDKDSWLESEIVI